MMRAILEKDQIALKGGTEEQAKKETAEENQIQTGPENDDDPSSYSCLMSRFCCPMKANFSKMSANERKDRIQFLWGRLRLVVKHRGLL